MTPRRPPIGLARVPESAAVEGTANGGAADGALTSSLAAVIATALQPRLAYTISEAAACLGIGTTAFRERILPSLRVVFVGRKPIVPRAELEKYLEREARRMLADELDRDRRAGLGR